MHDARSYIPSLPNLAMQNMKKMGPGSHQDISDSEARDDQRSESDSPHQDANHSRSMSKSSQPIDGSEPPIDQQEASTSNTTEPTTQQIIPENTGHHIITRAKGGIFKQKIYNTVVENDEPSTYYHAIQNEKWKA